MENAIKVKLVAGYCAGVEIPEPRWVIVNQSQICWVDSGKARGMEETEAVLHMANGDVILISEPAYSAWENDTIIV